MYIFPHISAGTCKYLRMCVYGRYALENYLDLGSFQIL